MHARSDAFTHILQWLSPAWGAIPWEAMAASSGDDIPAQLAALLGHSVKRIRITDDVPPRISVIDLAAAITMKDANQAAEQVAYVKKRHPEVTDFSVTSNSVVEGRNIRLWQSFVALLSLSYFYQANKQLVCDAKLRNSFADNWAET